VAETSRHPCERCEAALGRSCCQVGDADRLATLTLPDVERIEVQAGVARQQFLEEEWLSEEEVRTYVQRRPLYDGYFRWGPVRLTLQRKSGACVFFAPGRGCTLGEDVRPTACRLYPFDVSSAGELRLQVDRFLSEREARAAIGAACLAVQEASGWDELAALFHTTTTKVLELSARLREEVRHHARGEERKRNAPRRQR
jgi:Fe-S-cluster containining protein